VTFERYVCWKPEDLGWIAEIDVAGVQHLASEDDSLFLATHQPTKVKETTKDGDQGALVADDVLLGRFKAPISGIHHNFLITGGVGTGKSHLVKWLHANCSQEESWHHVYIEKSNTSLRKVIRTILADLSGRKVNELREKLEEANTQISNLQEAKARVLSELALKVEFPESEVNETQYEIEARNLLPPLLTDLYLKEFFLNEQGAVHRITRISYEGLTGDDDERDLFFTEDDLPLDPAELPYASRAGQHAVRILAGNKPLRNAAVKILNLELARAKASVFIGTGIDLLEVFDEVRKELKNQDLELALYIEDLVVLHGIDLELAQALSVGKGTGGERCGLRTAIAVTDGYLHDGFDTLTTRAHHYSLNLNTTEHLDEEFTLSYIARYLNAARVGLDGLTRAHKKAKAGENWLPNACQSCDDYRTECHGTFGRDANGYGLYPFNTEAVGRLTALANEINPPPENFDPREIVRWVVGDALEAASEELPKGEFPSKNFAQVLDSNRTNVAVDVRNDLSEEDHGQRRIALLNFWASPPVEEITNLKPGIHTAFALPERSNTEIVGPKPPIIVDPDPPPKVDKLAAAIDAWANGDDTLSAPNARTVRQFVFGAVVERIRYGHHGRRITGTARELTVGHIPFKDTDVRIESAQGGGAELERPFSIKIPRNTKMAVFLKTVLKVADDKGWSGIEAKRFAEATSLLDRWVEELLKTSKPRKADLDPALQLLAITAQPGLSESEPDGTEVEALIQGSSLGGDRTGAWNRWQKKAERLRIEALRQVEQQSSQAKGTGSSSLLDAAQVLPRLKTLKTTKELGTKLEGDDAFVEELRTLAEYQSSASTSEWKEVTKLLDRLDDHLTGAKGRDVLVGAVEKAVGEAHNLGVLPTGDTARELAELAEQVDSSVFSTVGRLREVTDAQAGDLWQLLPDPRGELEALVSYVETAADVIQSLEVHVESSQSGSSGTGDLPALRKGLRDLGDLLDEVVESGAV